MASANERRPATQRSPNPLPPETELGDEIAVALDVDATQVVEHSPTPADEQPNIINEIARNGFSSQRIGRPYSARVACASCSVAK